ncbi:MAG: MFS transporter [Candidatus Lokiarchaeota archaeon]|nr:MFS transporter [Candidatus Lokiarchaeota archaeon]
MESELTHSKLNMASYGFAKFLNEFIEMAFTAWCFYFYEQVLGLETFWVGIGYIIFALWNAVNDPLMGFLTNRPFKFTRKWGRRFPWIIIGGVPYILSYTIIFAPPGSEPLILFLWLIFSTCLFDTFNSIFFINYVSLFPDKFRSVKERRTATAVQTPIGIIGIALGALIPPMIIDDTAPGTFIYQAVLMAVIGLVVIVLAIPGCREDRETIDLYLKKEREKTPFFQLLKTALSQKSFLVFIITYSLYRCLVISFQASIPYLVDFVLLEDEIIVTILSAAFLLGSFASSPLWARLAHKSNNNKKAMLISAILLIIFTLVLAFIDNWMIMFVGIIFWGIGLGGFWTMISPVLADVIDEAVVTTQSRQEGIYNGFLQFFGRLGILFQALTFSIIHIFTGFVEGALVQDAPAIIGIKLHFSVIPAIVMLIGTIVFWKFYKLTPDKVKDHQERVIELKL